VEGGWKAADVQGGHKASLEDLVLKAGYLWKKGERRKVNADDLFGLSLLTGGLDVEKAVVRVAPRASRIL
jgi:hypothetical protein